MSGRKAIFLDLFGTLVEDHGVAERVVCVKFKPGAIEALKRFEDAGFIAFVSVCHETIKVPGYDYVKQIQARLLDEVARHKVSPASIHFTGTDIAAKPMTEQALRALAVQQKLSLPKCIIVGDVMKDVKIGSTVGARTALLSSEEDSPAFEDTDWIAPDFVVADLGELVDKVVRKRK